jgi:hypothetical protein
VELAGALEVFADLLRDDLGEDGAGDRGGLMSGGGIGGHLAAEADRVEDQGERVGLL